MNRGEWQDLFNWAWNDVWPNHLGEPLLIDDGADISRRVTEAIAVTAEFYEKHRARGLSHEDAKHRTFEDIMRLAGRVPTPPPTGRILRPIQGQLRISNGSFSDDTGPRLLTMCHAGDLAMRSSYDWDGAMRALDVVAGASYHGIRVWDRLRWGGTPGAKPGIHGDWGHEIVSAETWEGQMRAFLDACRSRQLVVHVAAGDLARLSTVGRQHYLAIRALLTRDYPTTIALNEWANEARDTAGGLDVQAALRDMMPLRTLPPLTALTAYTGHEDDALFRQWTPPPQAFTLAHVLRDGHWWDKLRHLFSLPYEMGAKLGAPGRLWWHGEPWGPGKLVSVTENKHELTDAVMGMGAAQALVTGGTWTYFCSPGVVLGDERFEDHAGFANTPKVAAALEQFAADHGGINWGKLTLTHGGLSQSARHAYEIAAGGEHARCDQAIDRDRGLVVATVYGPDPIRLRPIWTFRESAWLNPETAELVDGVDVTRTLRPGILLGVRA